MADRVFCLVLMVLVAAFWMETAGLPGPTGGAAVGPAFFPQAVLGLLGGLATLLLIRSFLRGAETTSFRGISGFLRLHWRVPALLGMLVGYVALLDPLGFVLSSSAFLLGGFALMIREHSRGVLIAAVALALTLPFSLDLLFQNILRTVLP